LRLSDITLTVLEVPEQIMFGGSQRIVAHRLADGRRVFETLGPDESDILFRGIFTGADAESRARAIDTIRQQGNTVSLQWQSFKYDVIVRTFTASYNSPWWISYSLRLAVVKQNTAVSSQSPTNLSSILADLADARSGLAQVSMDSASLPSSAALTAATTSGTSANRNAMQAITSVIASIDQRIDQAGANMATLTSDESTSPDIDVMTALSVGEILAILTGCRALLSRALVTLAE
jgi:hypothetical protein